MSEWIDFSDLTPGEIDALVKYRKLVGQRVDAVDDELPLNEQKFIHILREFSSDKKKKDKKSKKSKKSKKGGKVFKK